MTATTPETAVEVNPAFAPLIDAYRAGVDKANAIANQYRNEMGGLADKVAAYINETDDAEIVKVRDQIAKRRAEIARVTEETDAAEAALHESAEAKVAGNSPVDTEALESEFLEMRKALTAQRKGLESFGVVIPDDIEELVSLKSKTTRQGNSTGTGSSTSRSSFSEITINGVALSKPTPTEATRVISKDYGPTTAAEIRESLKNAHGDVSDKYGEPFTFSHTVTKNNKPVTLTITVVPTENIRGKRAQSQNSETDSE